jgi:hypothetical protein
MAAHISPAHEPADDQRIDNRYRCLSCNGIITGLAEQDLAAGLNVKLGLVSDECGLVCNQCTAKLIQARANTRRG